MNIRKCPFFSWYLLSKEKHVEKLVFGVWCGVFYGGESNVVLQGPPRLQCAEEIAAESLEITSGLHPPFFCTQKKP